MASQVKQRKREQRRLRNEGTHEKRAVHEGQPGGQDRGPKGRAQGQPARKKAPVKRKAPAKRKAAKR